MADLPTPESISQPDLSGFTALPTPRPSSPAAPPHQNWPQEPNPLSASPLAPIQNQPPDAQRQFFRQGIPQVRATPLPSQASAAVNAQAQSITKVIIEPIQQQITALQASGGSINGTTTAPHVPYTSAPDTLSDSTWTFVPSGNILGNAQTSSEINMVGSGGNQIELGLNVSGATFPTFISIDDSAGDSLFLGLKPSAHEVEFSMSDGAGDGLTTFAENGSGVNSQWIAASLLDNIIIDCKTNDELLQMESGLGGLALWELRSSGASDFEQADHGGSFFEIFQDGTGTTSFLQMEDTTAANVFQIDINKGGTAGTVAVTLKSPKPSIALGSATSPTIFAGSGAPTGSAPNASLYLRSGGTHAGLSLLYVYDAATTSWIGIG